MAEAPGCDAVLEAEISVLCTSLSDKEYDRPLNPALLLLGDARSGMMLKFEMLKPEDDPVEVLAEVVVEFVFQYGIPEEIRVSNVIAEADLEQICDVCGIRLRRGKRLQGVEEFMQEMDRFQG